MESKSPIRILLIALLIVGSLILYLELNPPEPWLDEHTQLAVENLIDDTCPELRPLYNSNLDEGRIDVYVVEGILAQCSEELKGEVMYQMLIRDLSGG